MKITIYLDNGHVITLPDCADAVVDQLNSAISTYPHNVIGLTAGIYIAASKINYFKVEK